MVSIAKAILDKGYEVCWLTSSAKDKIFEIENDRLHCFDIGAGFFRILCFTSLRCNLLITTTPDLGQNQIKRSIHNPYYVFVHHSLVSHHMVYRPKAFQDFDAIMCVGPHHISELEEEEELFSIPKRNKIPHGYDRLDTLIDQANSQSFNKNSPPKVLIAPSWGKNAIIEGGYADQIIASLLQAGFYVTLRPHPRTFELAYRQIYQLKQNFPNLLIDDCVMDASTILSCDLMISDWSGVALEYAFARLRPVLYVNTPKKINNLHYAAFKNVPVEIEVREKLGVILSTNALSSTGKTAKDMMRDLQKWQKQIAKIRSAYVFNIGTSSKTGADQLIALKWQKNL